MGGGAWSTDVYAATTGSALNSLGVTGTFGYSTDVKSTTPRNQWEAHEALEPKGVEFRESRDSDEHPQAVSIAVLFDVTGSMSFVPQDLVAKLPELLNLLKLKGYVPDAQVLFGAIGDATCDQVPLQVGQFESDNRMDENLTNIFLEGGGGGQQPPTESYELAMYFMARHTALDSVEKRGHKGYLFIIGDEMPYPMVKAREVLKFIGDDLGGQNITLADIVQELKTKYEVFFIVPGGIGYSNDTNMIDAWKALLGDQFVSRLDDISGISEEIATRVNAAEETYSLTQTLTTP